jgi:hypothetical protein
VGKSTTCARFFKRRGYGQMSACTYTLLLRLECHRSRHAASLLHTHSKTFWQSKQCIHQPRFDIIRLGVGTLSNDQCPTVHRGETFTWTLYYFVSLHLLKSFSLKRIEATLSLFLSTSAIV